MRDRDRVRLTHPTLTFEGPDVWAQLPAPARDACRALLGHLLRVVLQQRAASRRSDERQDSTDAS